MAKKKLKIGVLYGGTSNEREISILTGKEIIRCLPRDSYDVFELEITKRGIWKNKKKKKDIDVSKDLKEFDCIFIALHGAFGEDGTLQAILDLAKVPYTGSGVLSSAIGFDKMMTLYMVKGLGIKTPKFMMLDNFDEKDLKNTVKKLIKYPCVVKPNRSGSSVGISIIKKPSELPPAVKKAKKEDSQILIEEFIDGIELTCGVLGDIALPVVEIIPGEKFFDYHAKYFSKKTQEICPARIKPNITRRVKTQAKKIHDFLRCSGLTRSDFILKGNKLYFLEINTLPGLTSISLCPKEAATIGMSFPDFLSEQIMLAIESHKNRK
tara:strand:+ start:225 stop:1193 length:969 start_codon:yes stop_codon:yes gene_type:complete